MLVIAVLAAAAEQVTGALGEHAAPDAIEARRMQALSFVVHIPVVCFGIAFPAMFLFVHGLYLRTGEPHYKALAKRWSKVALIVFALGVVTGTILSFEFGLLWPDFMATWGDVFGLAFGLEGVSFFVEAIFMTIYVYGWDRLPPRAHFITGIPVVVSGFMGSLNVIAVNGWMNSPQGFSVVDGRVTDPRPWHALFNDHLPHELIHMYLAGYMVAGFIVAGVYAYARMHGKRDAYHRTGLIVALSFATLATLTQGAVGDWAGRTVAATQPVKLAAFEGVPHTADSVPFTIGGIYDPDDQEVRYGIEIPYLLSLLSEHDPTATVIGLDSVPEADQPPVNIVRFAFQTMVGAGTALGLLSLVYLYSWWRRRRLPRSVWFLRAVIVAGPLALLALIGGWVATEVGRQPWIVYQTMRTSDAVTASDGLEVGFAVLVAVYLGLTVALVWLLRRLTARPERELAELGLMLPEVCVGLVVLGITAYAVLGGADFGAGFWDLTAGGDARGGRVRGMVQRSMSPVWEANHVWLIFVLVIAWTAFPVAFGSLFSTLSIPLFLAALGIISRGAAFALRGQAATIREARVLGATFAVSSVLVPFFLGAALGGIASGRVPVGNVAGDVVDSWINPTSIAIGVLAVVSGAYIAAVYLAADSVRAGQPDLAEAFRARALGAAVVAGAVAIGSLFVLRSDARPLFDGLTSGKGLVAVLGSAAFGAVTIALITTRMYGPARFTAAAAVGAVTVGWALAQDPYLLPGAVTLDEGTADDTVLEALVISIAVGFVILVPSLWYLYRLVLRGTLDTEYEPLDQRFNPLRAGDDPEVPE